MNTKTDEGLYEKARKLFISKASIDEFAGWATPRQVDAVHRLLDTELANRERAKHDRLLRRARFPVVKGLDGYDFTNVRLPDGYMLDELLGLGFIPRAVLLQCLFDRFGSVFPQCGLMVFPGVVIVSR